MKILEPEAIKNVLRQWSIPEDVIQNFGIRIYYEVAKAQLDSCEKELQAERERIAGKLDKCKIFSMPDCQTCTKCIEPCPAFESLKSEIRKGL